MTDLQTIEKKGNEAVKKLRSQKLADGHPFMINSKDLEDYQCYLEYPDGSIKLVYLIKSATAFTVLRTLSSAEAQDLRKKYQFFSK